MMQTETLHGVCYFHSETGTEGGYWAFQDENFIVEGGLYGQQFEYQGLHILENGYTLTIYDKIDKNKILWHGVIDLTIYPLFTQATSRGNWIHADQKGVERTTWERWFLEEYPATLTLPVGIH